MAAQGAPQARASGGGAAPKRCWWRALGGGGVQGRGERGEGALRTGCIHSKLVFTVRGSREKK